MSLDDCNTNSTHLDLKLEIRLDKENIRFTNKAGDSVITLAEYDELHFLQQSKYKIQNPKEYIVDNIDSLHMKCFVFKELTRKD